MLRILDPSAFERILAQLIYSTEDEPALRGAYERLSELKHRYDLENVLHLNQNFFRRSLSLGGL